LVKFDFRTDEGIFLGYSFDSNAYKCYNLRLDKIVMSANVKLDDERSHRSNLNSKETKCGREYDYLEERQHEEKQEEEKIGEKQ